MNTSDFTSNFWNIYIAAIIVISFIGLVWLLFSQNKVKKNKNEQADITGHEWDGIVEYNNPLPKWWFWLFVLTIIYGIGYLVVYPGFGEYKGAWGWTSHNQYDKEMEQAREHYQPIYDQFKDMSIEDISKNKDAKAIGQNLFNTYCIQCHGSDAKGAKGFPNLTDHDWLWGGEPETIQETISDGRLGIMQPYGGSPQPLSEEATKDVTHYVLSLNENAAFRDRANPDRAARGKVTFDQVCFACHQPDGKGMVGMAPNLTDNIWLWGGNEKDIMNTVIHGHTNEMPAWKHFLVSEHKDGKVDDSKLRILTAYVWGLSNTGENTTSTQPKAEPTPAKEEAAPTAETPAAPAEAESATTETPAAEPAKEEAAPAPEATADENVDKVVVGTDGMVKFYFATASHHLADGADAALADIVAGVKAGKGAVISGFHDKTGNAQYNQKLAKERAKTVRDELIKLGVPEDKIEMKKPESTVGEGSLAEARRVEVILK